jgi:serine phosphatase RsbU (regulator of sigma subunit)
MTVEIQEYKRVRVVFRGPGTEYVRRLLQAFEGNQDPCVTILPAEDARHADAVLWELPCRDDQALGAFAELRAELPEMPIVVIGRREDDALAERLVKAGAQDCVFEDDPSPARVRLAIRLAINRVLVLAALRQSRRLLQRELDALAVKYRTDHHQLGRLRGALNVAAKIQSHLLPADMPRLEGYDIAAYYHPCEEVGGDYYDFIPLDPERLGIVVADVSGKSIPGLAVMTMFRSLLRMNARRSFHAMVPLKAVNMQIADDLQRGMFVTCCYAILNHTKRELLVSSAGHPPLLIWRSGTSTCQAGRSSGMLIGFDRGPMFDSVVKEERVALEAGDRVLIYSDGLTETERPDGELFGQERIVEQLRAHAGEDSTLFVEHLIGAVNDFRGEAGQTDDITVVTFRYAAGG